MSVFDNRKLFDADKVQKSLSSTVWETPPEIFTPLNIEFRFTVDVCALSDNKKCEKYFSPEQNGLQQEWDNEVCWCNPPYGNEVPKWCNKALQQSKKGTTTVLLIPCKTNTNWWHDIIIPHAEVRFLKGRVKFIQNGIQSTQALPWPLAVVIYRPRTPDNLLFTV